MTDLALNRVSKNFGGVVAAATVTMEIVPGRITGLIGPNGAGKSTLVNLITGMLPVSSGTISFGARDITTARADEIARLGFARTFQNIRLFKEATVLDNLLIGYHSAQMSPVMANILGLPGARAETRNITAQAYELLDRFGMTRYADFSAGGLAYGHQRRVEMMRALASAPSVLLLDEPVAGMNDVEAGELGDIFRSLASSGMAILLIEHNIRFVTKLCEYIYVLSNGRIIAEDEPANIVANPAVIAAYLGD